LDVIWASRTEASRAGVSLREARQVVMEERSADGIKISSNFHFLLSQFVEGGK
jgi:hypothetical protein